MPWPGRPMTGASSLGLGITVYASGMPSQKNNSSFFPGTNSLCIRWHGHPISSVLPLQAMTGLCKYGKRSKEESVMNAPREPICRDKFLNKSWHISYRVVLQKSERNSVGVQSLYWLHGSSVQKIGS